MADNINPDHYKQLPAEAIEIIEAAINSAPSNQDAYLHGQVLKYILRCWNKNGIEDLKKAKWYLDRLIGSFETHVRQKAADLQSLKDHPFGKLKEPAIKQSLTPEPPDGWRWLEVGEVIRNGDRYFTDNSGSIDCLTSVGEKFNHEAHCPVIRRNRFEVGEKVVDFCGQVWEVEYIFDTGNRYRLKHKEVCDEGYGNSIAPYIEDAT